jgi:hypothetical protein
MSIYQKLMLAVVYVLGSDAPVDISFDHGGHHYDIYNYVESGSWGLDIGVDFDVDNGRYEDLWCEIRRNKTTDYDRLHKAIKTVVESIKAG